MEEPFQMWLKNKRKYLTNYTLNIIESEWRGCGLEELILRDLYNLWLQIKLEGLRWKPNLAEISVDCATEWAKSMAEKHNKPLCHYLTMALKIMKNYYESMKC
ncbi:MAG: hypothetical protein N3E47_08215 [Candidatus Bathyarchaeota archaeon]|nr:hypothetical protein [Candidatus Bathyarchaeota archaeon]